MWVVKRATSLFNSFCSVVAKQSCTFLVVVSCFTEALGSLNNDGDGIENGKKAIGLDNKINNFARASHFFVNLFVVVTRKTS